MEEKEASNTTTQSCRTSKNLEEALGFYMFLLCQPCALVPSLHQKWITERSENRWQNWWLFGLIFRWTWGVFSNQLGIKTRSKSNQKTYSKNDQIFDRCWLAFGSVLETKLVPKSIQNRPKTDLQVGSKFSCMFAVGGELQKPQVGGGGGSL